MARKIYIASANKTLRFAARELSSYIQKMTGSRLPLAKAADVRPGSTGFLIRCDDLSGRRLGSDEFEIKPSRGLLVLRGNRPRSCLYAVYAYLDREGVRFVRPGPDGELVPRRRALRRNVRMHERASYDHRCVCNEGATSIEHAVGMVDWMAKHRMNEFHLQFETSLPFWNRWYAHEGNPRFGASPSTGKSKRHRGIGLAESRRLDAIVIKELKLRGMDVHRMGHGWTCGSLGIPARGWETVQKTVPPALKNRIAMVNSKRQWHRGIPANTELCYSNPEAFDGIVETVVRYAARHPEADAVLFCTADGMNQWCECARCRTLSPSDWYARLVNAIGEALHARGLSTRVSFDAYVDVLQAPERECVRDPHGNLIFMLAPFFRCYEHPLAETRCDEDYPVQRWALNRTPVIFSNRAYVQLLRQWQARMDADSMLCDYHFYFLQYFALDEMLLARLIHQDVTNLLELGFNGIFSCQVLRAFYPTALGMTVMAESLWNRECRFDEVMDRHIKAAFGPFARGVADYLQTLGALFKPDPEAHDHLLNRPTDARRAGKAVTFVEQWAPRLARMRRRATTGLHARSLEYLEHYNTLLSFLCKAAASFAAGDTGAAERELSQATEFACNTEQQTHWALDTWMLNFWHTERIARWTLGRKGFTESQFEQGH